MSDKKADVVQKAAEPLTSNQTSRTGHSAFRVACALDAGVDPGVIALQVTLNSRKNNPNDPVTMTGADIVSVGKWFDANKTRSALPKLQAEQMIGVQRSLEAEAECEDSDAYEMEDERA